MTVGSYHPSTPILEVVADYLILAIDAFDRKHDVAQAELRNYLVDALTDLERILPQSAAETTVQLP